MYHQFLWKTTLKVANQTIIFIMEPLRRFTSQIRTLNLHLNQAINCQAQFFMNIIEIPDMNRFVIVLFFIVSSRQAFSQFNDSVHYYVYYGSTGVINKTNDGNSYVLSNVLRFSVSKKIM